MAVSYKKVNLLYPSAHIGDIMKHVIGYSKIVLICQNQLQSSKYSSGKNYKNFVKVYEIIWVKISFESTLSALCWFFTPF